MDDPFTAVIDGDRLSGRGACDMKGGCAALVVAAETLARSTHGTPRLVLALVADEEDRSVGTEAVIAALPGLGLTPDVAVVAEPTWLDLATGHRGYAVAEVVFTGRAAHSSQPEEGVNAITHLGRFLARVEQAATRVEERGGSLMVTVVDGGSAPFSIPAAARALVERRTVPGERADDLLDEINAILDDLRPDLPELKTTVRLTHARESWSLADAGPSRSLATELESTLHRLGHARGSFAAPYWMESALWEAAGIPALVCGPAGGGLHASDEWVSIAQVEDFVAALVEALPRWAGHAD